MPICERHTRYIPEGQYCGACWSEGVLTKKVEEKATKQNKSSLTKQKEKIQAILSKMMKDKYCKTKYTNCWTCGKPTLSKGTSITNTVHCGHYYPKAIYWPLSHLLINTGVQCWKCNTLHQGIIPAMRPKLVEIWGEEKIKELDAKADQFIKDKNLGIIKSKPDSFQLLAMIQELKSSGKK